MKKTLLLIASAALLLAGCAKEKTMEKSAVLEGEETYSFTVGLGAETKGSADDDGKAAEVNHWVMEVLDSDKERYTYQEHDGQKGVKTHTFNVKLIKGQTYTVLFWADTKGAYVTTDLRNVTLANTSTYAANLDSRDAFSAVKTGFSTVEASSQEITLTRPLAQLNVVFTDLKDLYETMGSVDEYAKFKPGNFVVKAKVPTSFNVLDQTAGAPATTALTMTAATNYLDNYSAHGEKATLYMDYFFASAGQKDLVDIDFSFVSKGVGISHNFTSIPFQRNYRTNILGNFMSADAEWKVKIDPEWDSKDDGSKDINVDYVEVNKASEVKEAIKNKTEDPNKEGQGISVVINSEVGSGEVNDDIIIPDNTPKATTPEIILDFKKLSTNAQIVIRDQEHPREAAEATTGAKEYDGEVVVIVPEGTTAEQVKILTNKSTVTVRGEYGKVIASCAPQTIIVEKGTVIDILEVMKGNVEVYGKVTSIVNKTAEAGAEAIVYVYMYEGAVWTKVENQKNEKLVPLYPVASIGANQYFSLQDAVDAAPANSEIKVLGDIAGDGLKVASGKNFTLNFDGHTYTIDGTVGSQGTETNGMQLLKGSTLKFVNGTIVSTKAKLLIQNYANLTLEDMNLDLSGATGTSLNYVISNNCGNVQILGNTSLKSRSGDGAAFDIYYWPQGGYTDGVNIVVNTTGTITGRIEMAHDNSVSDEAAIEKTSLKIQNGTFDAFAISAFDGANVEISGGKFSTEPKSNYIIIGKKTVKNGNYYELTDSDNWVDFVRSQPADYVVDNSAKTVTLGSRDALIWFSKQTQSNQGIYPRYTITLTTDVDLSGKYWTPICAWNADNPLTFDGDNHTVSNMMTRKEGENENYRSFFGHITANIKNFTMTGAKVLSSYAYTGVVSGDSYGNFENVHIVDCTVNGDYWCLGGITGFHNGGNMKNCSATRVSVTGGCPGGLVGSCNETNNRTYENCTASDCVLNDSVGFDAPYTYGAIIGVVRVKGVVMKNCSSSGMTYNSKSGVTYTSGDEGTQGAPAHALYGGAFDEVSVINE